MEIGNKNNHEPIDCHPSCSKRNPCNRTAVCPNKNQGNKKKRRQKKSNKTSCHRSCTKDNPCLGEVCQYKTQQPGVGNIGTPEVNPPSQGGIFVKGLFLGFLLGLIFAKLIAAF